MTDNLLWRVVTEKHVAELDLLHETESCKKYLLEMFVFPRFPMKSDEPSNTKTAAPPIALLMDLYMYLYAFSKEQEYTPEKISVLLAIMHRLVVTDLFEADRRNSPWTLTESFKQFQSLLLRHSVERPPISAGIFETADVSAIVDYITHSYYRHFNLYQSVFVPQYHQSIFQVLCIPAIYVLYIHLYFSRRLACKLLDPNQFRRCETPSDLKRRKVYRKKSVQLHRFDSLVVAQVLH
jgi:hypothetical protein